MDLPYFETVREAIQAHPETPLRSPWNAQANP